MMIRQETRQDHRAAEELTREAFWNKYRPGCVEHFLLHRLREDAAFLPQLTCVLEEDGRLIGHIAYCRAAIQTAGGSVPIAIFGPVSVLPEQQGRGYGSKLIRHTLSAAAEHGIGAVAITGDPDYYHRFGFVSGDRLGIRYGGAPETEDFPFFMVKELRPGFLSGLAGIYNDPPVYAVSDDDVNAFDRTFPHREKLHLPGQLFGGEL